LDGFHSNDHIGLLAESGLSIFTFSSPTLSLICTQPLKNPKAMNWPSFVQEQHVIREFTLVLGTDLSLKDHKPKSVMAHVNRTLVTGLNAKA
jgi:hypothetical protein